MTISKPDKDAKPQSVTFNPHQSPKSGLKGHGCSLHLQNQYRAKTGNMVVPKTSDPIQIQIKMPNPSKEPPTSSKGLNQDIKDMDVFCIFKIKIQSQNLEHGCTKDQ